jgi:hypothetical protein
VWDDSDMTPTGVGGRCLNPWQASKRLKDGRGTLQEVVVPLSHDAHLSGDPSSLAAVHRAWSYSGISLAPVRTKLSACCAHGMLA